MKRRLTRATALACATLTSSACSSVNVSMWPFGGDKEQDPSRTPAGATAYQCEDGKRLFVRYLDNGAAAWVILPDREFRLNRINSGAGTRYSNGSSTLDVKDNEVTLFDGAKLTRVGCKSSGS